MANRIRLVLGATWAVVGVVALSGACGGSTNNGLNTPETGSDAAPQAESSTSPDTSTPDTASPDTSMTLSEASIETSTPESGTEAGSEGGGTEAGLDGGGGDGGSCGIGSGTGEFSTGVPACNQCLKQHCCSETTACAADASCVAIIECVAECLGDGGTLIGCEVPCAEANPAGVTDAQNVGTCEASSCGSECPT